MKLWQKNYTLNKEIASFTVGNDFLLDQKLLKYDIKVNLAHAKMLNSIDILTKEELAKISKTLQQLNNLAKKGKFKIKKEQEDKPGKPEKKKRRRKDTEEYMTGYND